ncbi:helix-turn-helix domain-containing protein [Aquibacillus rhizosphaerae]|uniref:DUF4115 domain-containing protein n=1 Tax=Aquibacillus rhizosphaerae TaxID=3051431 RepID=A0ABT7KZQ5_9BACI|nr:RodZ domain-containing protein [Aquibacillus sp. LR5S19]MDL4838998.1 DUF4115 domain-containing protein [Aquibacillus sp. LR5S19]
MELGSKLKEAREAKNLSLDDLQKITKIQSRYLQAIEKSNYEVMPGNFYIRAFIKEYATAVDLDPEELMEEHRGELPSSSDESSIQYSRVQRSRKDTSSTKSPAIFSFLPTVMFVLLIVGIIFMVWWFNQEGFLDGNNDGNQFEETEGNNGGDTVTLPPDEQETDDSADEETEEDTGNEETEEEQADEEDTSNNDTALNFVETENENGSKPTSNYNLVNPGEKVTLQLESAGNAWFQVENGKGKVFESQSLSPDNSPLEIDMTGEEQIYINVGNAADLTIKVNGVELEYEVDRNEKVTQNIWINIKKDSE